MIPIWNITYSSSLSDFMLWKQPYLFPSSIGVTVGRYQSCCHEYSNLFVSITFLLVSNKWNLQFICQPLVNLLIWGWHKLSPEISNPFSGMANPRIKTLGLKQFCFCRNPSISLVTLSHYLLKISFPKNYRNPMLALCTQLHNQGKCIIN